MKVLVTGGCGYIGSHACVALSNAGYTPVILDNFCNSSRGILEPLSQLCKQRPHCYSGDIRDSNVLDTLFDAHKIEAVMHFAGLKAVGESTDKPVEYYDNNVTGTLNLVAAMRRAGVKQFIFSSSATVYGDPTKVPIDETMPTGGTTNPYGTSKYMVERCLEDIAKADKSMSICLLRYFNPVGAHPSGLIGEDPSGVPNNLMPFITQVAVGRRECLSVFGDDYPTKDGTGVRDYIHVEDLVNGHVAALEKLKDKAGLHVYNLGTGTGTSVLEMVSAMETAAGKAIPTQVMPRRNGDIAECFADSSKAARELAWKAQYDLKAMAAHSWNWQVNNPDGYGQ